MKTIKVFIAVHLRRQQLAKFCLKNRRAINGLGLHSDLRGVNEHFNGDAESGLALELIVNAA
ncbi:hypothetical protein GCM10027040_30170 [Halomonas shantousis]